MLITSELEKLTDEYYDRLRIFGEKKQNLMMRYAEINAKDPKTGDHSLRVAMLSVKVVDVFGINNHKGIFYPGLLHDYGKIKMRDELLHTTVLSQAERNEMKEHVMNAFNLLKDLYIFSAWVLLWHHYYKPNDSYPTDKEIEGLLCKLSKSDKEKAKQYGLFLSMADVYDALITRANHQLGRKLTPAEAKPIMLESFPKNQTDILKLYDAHLLGVDYDKVLQPDYKPLIVS